MIAIYYLHSIQSDEIMYRNDDRKIYMTFFCDGSEHLPCFNAEDDVDSVSANIANIADNYDVFILDLKRKYLYKDRSLDLTDAAEFERVLEEFHSYMEGFDKIRHPDKTYWPRIISVIKDDIKDKKEIIAIYYVHTNAYDALLYRNDEIGTYKSLKCDGSDSFPILGEDEEAASEYLEEISDFYWNISGGDELTKKEFLDFIDACDPFEHPENRHNLKIVASLIIREN